MKVSVWDTYVLREDGKQMHFDIVVPDTMTDKNVIFNYVRTYLKSKSFNSGDLTSNECQFCHIENASQLIENEILTKGYYIIEMENCR